MTRTAQILNRLSLADSVQDMDSADGASVDEQQFVSWVDEHRQGLYAFLCRYTGNAEVAKDLLQESFLRVYRNRRRFRQGAPVKPWLYRIAVNLANDHFRRSRRHHSIAEFFEDNRMREKAPDATLAASDGQQLILNTLGKLPPAQRQVFILRHFEQRSYEEVAELLGRRVNTVKSDMRRALARLRTELAEVYHGR